MYGERNFWYNLTTPMKTDRKKFDIMIEPALRQFHACGPGIGSLRNFSGQILDGVDQLISIGYGFNTIIIYKVITVREPSLSGAHNFPEDTFYTVSANGRSLFFGNYSGIPVFVARKVSERDQPRP